MAEPSEWVTIRNPNLGPDSPTSETKREAFELTWKPRGFVIVDPLAAKLGAILGKPVDDVSKLTKDELATAVAATGLTVADNASKAEITDALSASLVPDTEAVA